MSASLPAIALPKISTGVPGLDEVLRGGYAIGRPTLISGGPGSGKTNLALSMVVSACDRGEPVVFVAFEENPDALRRNAGTLGHDLPALEARHVLAIVDAGIPPHTEVLGRFSLEGLQAILANKLKELGAQTMILDGLDALTQLMGDPQAERQQLYELHRWILENEITTLMTAKYNRDSIIPHLYDDFLNYLADCIINLENTVFKNTATRKMRVMKYRGSDFSSNAHPFYIGIGGVRVLPISSMEMTQECSRTRLSSGLSKLDEILGGGLFSGSTVLISGPTGSGKTTLAATLVSAATDRGERVLFVSYEMSATAMVQAMASPGIYLQGAIDTGRMEMLALLPEAAGAEEHLFQIIDRLNVFQPRCLVIDAISACGRMGSSEIAFDFLARLINSAKRAGVTTLLTNQTAAFSDIDEISGVGVSSLIDAVILVDLAVRDGELNRSILVLKSRGSAHSQQQQEFEITDQGIVLLDSYLSEDGLVMGTARRRHEQQAAWRLRKKLLDIEAKAATVDSHKQRLQLAALQQQTEIKILERELEIAQLEIRDLDEKEKLRSRTAKPVILP